MDDPIWIAEALALAIHKRQLAEHGGLDGVRDPGLLQSALAASYAFGIARNHPFIDGNKRTAAVVCETFLELNGLSIDATDADMYPIFLDLAAGALSEDQLASWLEGRARKRG